ncbi:MAG: SBBP repeat-containing protein [Candidatus Heimdallarchaeota archaeon]
MLIKKEFLIRSILAALLLNLIIATSGSAIKMLPEQAQQTDIDDFILSTYLGGNREDYVRNLVTDSQGNAIVTGYTLSTNFPVLNSYQDTFAGGSDDLHGVGGDAIVAKFDREWELLWSTYLGGSSMDGGLFVRTDAADNVIVLGLTNSSDFPTTADAFQQDHGGDYDLFIAKFASNGSLMYSSYLGTAGNEGIGGFEIASSGNLIISGSTSSADFPVTVNADQSSYGGETDGFVIQLSANCSSLLYSTFLGGNRPDGVGAMAIDAHDNIAVTGFTISSDFPLTENAYQDTIHGTQAERDLFVVKYTASGQLAYATSFGGSDMDGSFGITIDSSGDFIFSGRTWSSDFPTANAYQESYSGVEVDGFVSKLSANGQDLIFSSYFGGSGWDTIHHVAVDSASNIIASGIAGPDGVPSIDAFQEDHHGAVEVVALMISPEGQPLFSSFLGGTGVDHPWNQYLSNEHFYIVGTTTSSDFPVTSTAYQITNRGNQDGFIFRFDLTAYLASQTSDTSHTSENGINSILSSNSEEVSISLFSLAFSIGILIFRRRTVRR